jgi:hypothetical protein
MTLSATARFAQESAKLTGLMAKQEFAKRV